MNRNERDWPAARAAASARMKELNLTAAELAGKATFVAPLSLMDVGQDAQMAADYRAYVSMVAHALSEGMNRGQRSAASRFLSDLSRSVLCQ
jgi:hypothetical protein